MIPGMNDWTLGLGSYQEDKEKFPHGLKNLSDSVHSAGMKFGLWIYLGNVDAARVTSGEIPSDWLAMIDGKTIGTTHPSLAITKQLCLGDPEKVVAWVEKQLGRHYREVASGLDQRYLKPSTFLTSAIAPIMDTARPMASCRVQRPCRNSSLSDGSIPELIRI